MNDRENKVKIVMTNHGKGTIFVNDIEMKKVKGVKFEAVAEGMNMVTV